VPREDGRNIIFAALSRTHSRRNQFMAHHTAHATTRGIHVPAGHDRFAKPGLTIWGLIPLAIKLSAKDTGGELLVFQRTDMGRGGPPKHVHHDQDEWFYVVKGEFAAEIGEDRFILRPGDALFAPRRVPHA